MIPHSSPLFAIGDHIADAVNPVLAICLVVSLIISTRRKTSDGGAWVAAILGVVVVYMLHRFDGQAHLWKKIGADYSTHSAIAAALLVPMICLRRRLWPLHVGALLAYAALMIVLGFHTWLDIASTLCVIVPILVLLQSSLACKAPVEAA
jgi:hypothetical protein